MENFALKKIEDHFWKFSFFKFQDREDFEKKSVSLVINPNRKKILCSPSIDSQKGQGLVEYMILVALITAGTIGVVRVVGYNIGIQYENINRALGAKAPNQLQAVSADQSILNKKDLSNFLNGTK